MSQESVTEEVIEESLPRFRYRNPLPRAVSCSSCDKPARGWKKKMVDGKPRFRFYCSAHQYTTSKEDLVW